MNPNEPHGSVPQPVQAPQQGAVGQFPAQPATGQTAGDHKVDHSQYEFILNPQKPTKAGVPLLGEGSGTLRRALLFVGGLMILIIIIIVAVSVIGSSGNNATGPLLSVVQEQTELIRVAADGTTNSGEEPTQALSYAIQLDMTSAKRQLTKYANTNNYTLDPKLIGLKHSTTTDTELKNALTNSTYDTTLLGILQSDLNDYSQSLATAYKANPGPNGKKLLNDQYGQAKLLLQQCNQAISAASGN